MNERLNAIVGAKISEYRRKMAEVGKTIRSLPKNTKLKISVITKQAEKRIQDFQGKMDRLANTIRSIGTVASNMLGGSLLMVSPSMIPILSSAVGLLGTLGPMIAVAGSNAVALAASFGIAGGAALGFGAAAIPTIQKIIDGEAEATKENKKAAKQLKGLKKQWEKVQKTIAPEVAVSFGNAMEAVNKALKSLNPMFKNVAKTVADLSKDFTKFTDSKSAKEFFGYLNKNAAPILSDVVKGVSGLIKGFMNLTVAFGPLTSFMSNGFKGMGESFASFTERVKNSTELQSFINYLKENGPKLWAIVKNITGGLVGMFTAFGPLASDMMSGLQNLTAKFKEWGQSLSENQQFQKFIGYIRENAPTVMSLMGSLVTTLVNFGISIAPIGQKVLELANSFFSWTSRMLEAHPWLGKMIAFGAMALGAFQALTPVILLLGSTFSGLGGKIASVITRVIPLFNNFKLVFTTAFQTLQARIITIIPKILSFGSTIISGIGGAISKAIPFILRIGSALLRFATGPIGIAVQAVILLATIVIKNWDKIWATTKKVFSAIGNFLSNIWNSIKSWISNAISSIVSNVRQGWNNLKSNISNAMSNIKSNIRSGWNNIKSNISSAISNIVSTVKSKFTDIVNAVREKMNDAFNKVKEIGNKILSFFGGIDLYDSGKAIIQSAIDGLLAMKNKIIGTVEGIVQKVRNLWPFSPAKEGPLSDIHHMDFAGPIGMSINKARRPIMRSMTDLASVARRAFTPNVALADIGATATIDPIFNRTDIGAIEQSFGAKINDFEIPERPIIIKVEGDAEWIRAYVNEGNAIDDTLRKF